MIDDDSSPGGHAHDVDCSEAIHVLYHYLDGELTAGQRDEIQRHLEACSPPLQGLRSRRPPAPDR